MSALDSGNTRRDYARFAAPCILSLIIYSLYAAVDGVFVSRCVGSDALASINLGLPFIQILFTIALTLGSGTGTLIAKDLGAGDRKHANFLFSQNLAVAVIIGILLSTVTLVFLPAVCRFLGADADTGTYAAQYIGTLAPFAVFFILEYNLEFLIKTDGNPRLALIAVFSSSALNVFLDWLLVARWNCGVWGAALATGISQCFAVVLFLIYVLGSREAFLKVGAFRPDLSVYRKIIPIGLADGQGEFSAAVLIWVYNQLLLRRLGNDGVAAYTALSYVSALFYNLLAGCSQGMTPLLSYQRGARCPEKCRQLVRCALVTQAVFGGISFALVQLLVPRYAAFFFRDNPAVRQLTEYALRIYCAGFLLMGFNLVTTGFMSSTEHAGSALLISLGRGLYLHIPVLLLLSRLPGTAGIWSTCAVTETLTFFLSLRFLRKVYRDPLA